MRTRAAENSLWWHFSYYWQRTKPEFIQRFIAGDHRFSPMTHYQFPDESHRSWCYIDRLAIKLLLRIIKPTLKYIIAKRCYHMSGPNGVKVAIKHVHHALTHQQFNYVIRADIKGYYASIDRKILLNMLHKNYQDPRLQHYFEQIVCCAIDKGGDVFVPTTGIPRRSSLSPFFGALYLAELDKALSGREGIEYFRYMDDFIILAQTKRQYQRAKKLMFTVLKKLRLRLSPSKTKMGRLHSKFHFLGVNFEVTRISQSKTQVSVQAHPRTCMRALDRVKVMREDAAYSTRVIFRYFTRCYFSSGRIKK